MEIGSALLHHRECTLPKEGLNAEFQWFTMLYGIECSFDDNTHTRVLLPPAPF